ncbi:MAG: chloride channel protein [Oleiphilaceae bacterium]|nr:chloride channel protein [Oleiphilaceae bacterium]
MGVTRSRIWKQSRHMLGQITRIASLGILVGLSSAILANAFVACIVWLNDVLRISPQSRSGMEGGPGWLMLATVLVPAMGGLMVGLLHRCIREGRSHGPAEVIAAVQSRQGQLPQRTAILSGLSSLLSLGSGASVGQYGPLVHIGGAIGSFWSRRFHMDVSMGNMAIACGAAAAISTVFYAPIAGILFAQEVILRHFSLRAFAPISVASIVGYVAASTVLPQPPLFRIEVAEVLHVWEYGFFLLLGVTSAAVAVLYMSAILGMSRWAVRIPLPGACKPMVAGAVLGLAALWVPEILGIGTETLRLSIDGAYGSWQLMLILVLKLLATAWCLGMGFSGGVFTPALVVGSLFGALFGTALGLVFGDSLSALAVYTVCGMVAVTAPVIGAPLTTVVIVFEMTGNYDLTIAALASVALANLVASRLFSRSLFDRQLKERGLDLSGGRGKALLTLNTIAPLVSDRYVSLSEDIPVQDAIRAISHAHSASAYLVNADGQYRGTVQLPELMDRDPDQPARQWRLHPETSLPLDTSIWHAMECLRDFAGESVPVVDRDNRLVGTVFESDLIRTYLDILASMRREEYAAR